MPESSELPEDMTEWPADPFRLLGVSRDMDLKTARKAYAQLIKLYKPERKPAEFQKIREAWEFVQKSLKARGKGSGIKSQPVSPADKSPAETDPSSIAPITKVERPSFLDDDEPPVRSRGPTAPPSRQPSTGPLGHSGTMGAMGAKGSGENPTGKSSKRKSAASLHDDGELDLSLHADSLDDADFWDIAIAASNPQPSYDQFVRFAESENSLSQQSEVCLKLYWLLLVYPELDSRQPGDWLLAAWPKTKTFDEVDSRIQQQTLRELQRDTNFATSPPMLAVISLWQDEKFCLEGVRLRWQVCASAHQFDIIQHDLKSLKSSVGIDKERAWGQLVIAAIQIVVWKRDAEPAAAELYQWCRSQLGEISHLDMQTGHDYDRAEMLEEWVDALASHQPSTPAVQPWLEIVPDSFLKPWPQTRILLSPLLELAATDTATTLKRLTELTQVHSSLTVRLGELFLRYRSEDLLVTVRERPWDQAETVTREFLDAHAGKRYRQVRDRVLQFCTEACVDPRWVLPIARDFKFTDDWLEDFEDDLPILAAYDAYRAFWG